MSASIIPIRPCKPAALNASEVGTWEFDVRVGLVYIDPILSLLLGFAKGDGASGIPLSRFRFALHPLDRLRNEEVMKRTLREGGVFVFEHRTNPELAEERWILVRGYYEKDASTGLVTFGRGIGIDVTRSKRDGFAIGNASFARRQDDRSPIDRAIDASLAAHSAISEIGPEGRPSLTPIIELLLHELGRQIGSERSGTS